MLDLSSPIIRLAQILLLLAFAWAGWQYVRLRDVEAELDTLKESNRLAARALAHRDTGREKLAVAHKASVTKLQAATASAPAWADTPLPPEVTDALR